VTGKNLSKQERPVINRLAAYGLLELMNEKPFEHTGHYGTKLTADRCDFNGGVTITVPPGLSDENLASDLMEIAAWHAIHVYPHLNGFFGYDWLSIRVVK
jgi:hypothetical protein